MTEPSARSRESRDSEKSPAAAPPAATSIFNLPAADQLGDITPRGILYKARIIKLEGPVTQEMTNAAINDLLYFEATDPGKPITMLINSPGGAVNQGWAIIDMMNMISSPVHTCAIGFSASMGSMILLAGAKGHRSATPNASIMMHEATVSNLKGQAGDVAIDAKEMEHTKERMQAFCAITTGMSREVLEQKMMRDYYIYPTEALQLGVIDKIAGYPECKAMFNSVARKSDEAHMVLNKRQPAPALQ